MAALSFQITTSTTVQAVFTNAGIKNMSGSINDPLPVQLKNIDATNTIYIGGPAVSSSTGYPLLAGQSISTAWLQQEVTTLYCVASASTPILAVLTARQ